MGFKKGNTYGKGRPVGSQNKLTKANREFLHYVLFDQEQFLNDWVSLDLNGRMELRTRLAPYILPKAENVLLQSDNINHSKLYNAFGLDTPQENKEFNFREFMGKLKAKSEKEQIQHKGLPSNEQG